MYIVTTFCLENLDFGQDDNNKSVQEMSLFFDLFVLSC